jgi:uncharacterized LabA/DUF88 family protein
MLKAMMFIDGSWLDTSVRRLCDVVDADRVYIEHVRFQPIMQAVIDHVRAAVGFEIDLVRTYCVAGYPNPSTVASQSRPMALRIEKGWQTVRKVPFMEVELYAYDYGGFAFPNRDAKKTDDRPRPKEKCVDVALATNMLYFAAIPAAYDIAVLLTGDRDYKPVLKAVRRLGKRTVLATVLGLDNLAGELISDAALGDLWDIPFLDLRPVLTEHL